LWTPKQGDDRMHRQGKTGKLGRPVEKLLQGGGDLFSQQKKKSKLYHGRLKKRKVVGEIDSSKKDKGLTVTMDRALRSRIW